MGASKPPADSFEALSRVSRISVKLENGEVQEFSPAEELRIPDDPAGLVAEARKVSARFAFWAYQEELQLGRVRALERRLELVESMYDQPARRALHETTPSGITESAVRACITGTPEVRKVRVLLDKARKEYGLLRAMRRAMDHKCFAVDRLVAQLAAARE